MDKGSFGIVNIYMNNVRTGVGTFFRDSNDVLNGAMLLDKDVVMQPGNPFEELHKGYFSFEDENTGKVFGYHVYTSGMLEVGPQTSLMGTAVTFRKALVDVVEMPELKYVGMGDE